MKRKRPAKNPCPYCGRPMNSRGWCGSAEHDAGNPFGGITCAVMTLDKDNKIIDVDIREPDRSGEK